MLHTPTRCKGHLIVLLLVSFGSELVLLSVEMLVLPPLGLCKKQKQCFQTLRSLSATWGGAVQQAIKLSLCWQGDKAASQNITQLACGAAIYTYFRTRRRDVSTISSPKSTE